MPEWAMDFEHRRQGPQRPRQGHGTRPHRNTPRRWESTNLPPQLDDPNTEITPELIIKVFRDVAWHFFPRLAPEGEVH